ncbi:hypothetical protein B0H34DRAFT_261010 [Crassisporium funariophilum]|nr:hypothetical protein B0H34DRAFT_261010 [Crassisporium funariophilum]
MIKKVQNSTPLFIDFALVVTSARDSRTRFDFSTNAASTSTPPIITATRTMPTQTNSDPIPHTIDTSHLPTSTSSPQPTDTATATGDALGSTNASKTTNLGAVAGGIIAGVIILFSLFLAFVFWRRKHRPSRARSKAASSFWTRPVHQSTPPVNPITPFILSDPPPRTRNTMTEMQAEPDPYSPRYLGGYAPNHPQPPIIAESYAFTSSSAMSSYGHEQDSHPARAYIPPSQRIGVPTAYNPDHSADIYGDERTRIRLDN